MSLSETKRRFYPLKLGQASQCHFVTAADVDPSELRPMKGISHERVVQSTWRLFRVMTDNSVIAGGVLRSSRSEGYLN